MLLDGLDEIVNADERLGVVKQIEDFVRHYIGKANRFVITSRKAGYRSVPLGEPFTHYAVQEMDETQMRRFLERWCQAVEDAQTPELSLQERRNMAKREIESIMRAVQSSSGVAPPCCKSIAPAHTCAYPPNWCSHCHRNVSNSTNSLLIHWLVPGALPKVYPNRRL